MLNINNNNNYSVPREIPTATLGTTIAAASGVTIQYLESFAGEWLRLPTIAQNFAIFGCGAGAIAGTVMSVYSMIRLGQKVTSGENSLDKAVKATALGVLFTATVQAIGEHFWEIAPYFDWLQGHSMAFCIGTNFAWQACMIAGIGGIIFTAYAAYRIGQAILANVNQEPNTNIEPEIKKA